MNRIIMFSALIIIAFSTTVFAKSDYMELNRAIDKFISTVDGIEAVVPSVNDPAGTAQILNTLSQAYDDLRLELKEFITKNPEALNLEEPPVEIAASFGKLMRLFDSQQSVSKLVNKYSDAPEVQKATKRFVESINMMNSLKALTNQKDISTQKPERYSATCKAQFEYVYNLHVKSINSAKTGNCHDSLEQFETTIFEWRKLSDSINCEKKYTDLAKDGYVRAKHDLSVAKTKYCKDENATPNTPLQPSR